MSEIDSGFSVYWHKALRSIMIDAAPASLTSVAGECVHIECSSAHDLSLSSRAQFCNQYLKMKPGEMAIVNDPSSGGSSLGDICIVRAISLAGKLTDHVLAVRFTVGSTGASNLRIPPTPINKEIIQAICSHPGAAFDLEAKLNLHIEKLKILEDQLMRLKNMPGLSFTNDQLEFYFDSNKKNLLSWISKNLANGEFQFQQKLSTGENIKLRIECKEGENILFDFIGTGISENFQLTEFMSFSACFAALASLANFEIPANQGTFSALQLRTPQNSMLNAKQVKNPFLAARSHLPELCDFLRVSLLKLTRLGKNFAPDSPGIGPCAVVFKPNVIWNFHIPGGQGASLEKNGSSFSFGWVNENSNFSIEKTESDYSVQFVSLGKRHAAAKGLFNGGSGTQINFRILADAELDILPPKIKDRVPGEMGGKAGEKSQVFIEEEELGFDGGVQQKVSSGAVLRFAAGGGGGWGEEKIEEED